MDSKSEHRRFLNRYYGVSRHFYDLTRRYYLFGRDVVIRKLAREDWSSLVEIGPGTGRNLRKLHRLRPGARLGGLEASDAMLEHARARCPFASFQQGFAEDADLSGVLGRKPDRVLFSYCLSMVGDPHAALENARKSLAPGGRVVVVDFWDLEGLGPARGLLQRWLRTFHVKPLEPSVLAGARVETGPARYYVIAEVS